MKCQSWEILMLKLSIACVNKFGKYGSRIGAETSTHVAVTSLRTKDVEAK